MPPKTLGKNLIKYLIKIEGGYQLKTNFKILAKKINVEEDLPQAKSNKAVD